MCSPPPPSFPGVPPSSVRRHFPFSSSSSLGWMEDSVKHPSTLILDLFSLSHFSSFHRFPNCFRCHTRICFTISNSRLLSLPPLPLPPFLSRWALPFLPLSLSIRQSLLISISRSDSTVFQDGQHPYSSLQNITKHKYQSYSEVINHQSAIPSHPIIHIHIHMFIPIHRHRAYTSLI